MNDLLIQPTTKQSLENFIARPVHAVGLEGPAGSGKKQLANYIASQVLQLPDVSLSPYVLIIDCNEKVGIDEVRGAKQFLQLKIPGSANFRRCLIFYSFESLANEAQNALLKSFEEPPEDTLIIITTKSKSQLLKTIASRLGWLNVLPVSYKEATDYFSDKYDKPQIEKAYKLSGGKPAMMERLLADYENHHLAKAVEQAKTMLALDKFERLTKLEAVMKDSDFDADTYLTAFAKIFDSALKNQALKTNRVNQNLLKSLQKIAAAREAQNYNVNQKALLTDVFYNL